MKNIIASVSGLTLLITLSACVPSIGSESEPGIDEPSARTKSGLSGGPWTWVNALTGRCLTSGPPRAIPCNNSFEQDWTNVPNGPGDNIINAAYGVCLDGNCAGNIELICTHTCNGTDSQRWRVTLDGAGRWDIQNVANGRCLAYTSSLGLINAHCGAGAAKWQ
jgi:Ricin-type beta-trefoil lectin domain-like